MIQVSREHPVNGRHGLGDGAIPVKYDIDDTQVSNFQEHDFIVNRYSEVLFSMAEILNELDETSKLNGPVVTQESNDGQTLTSDGENSALSFINSIRVRAGLPLLQGSGKEALRDSILKERSHEFYAERTRRADLFRYQRVIKGL